MGAKLECWSCGGSLCEVPRPIARLALCPECRADLHVCRMCRFYDRAVLGECRHDRAERVLDKERANFCTHFRPRPRAHEPVHDHRAEAARAELEALFGEAPSLNPRERAKTEADRAREALEALFGVTEEEQSKRDESSG